MEIPNVDMVKEPSSLVTTIVIEFNTTALLFNKLQSFFLRADITSKNVTNSTSTRMDDSGVNITVHKTIATINIPKVVNLTVFTL